MPGVARSATPTGAVTLVRCAAPSRAAAWLPRASGVNTPRAVASQVKVAACLRAPSLRRLAQLVVGEDAVELVDRARPTSVGQQPALAVDAPSRVWPVMRVATAGVPQAAASVRVMPQPSAIDALATTQARR